VDTPFEPERGLPWRRIPPWVRHAVTTYLLLGVLWIVGSDLLIERLAATPESSTHLQSAKGIVFVLLSAAWAVGVVLVALARQQHQLDRVHAASLRLVNDQMLKRFFDLPFVGIAFTSPQTKRWTRFNDRLCDFLGYTRDELAALTWTEVTHPDDLAADVGEFTRVLAGQSDGYAMEKRFIRKDGAVVYAYIDVRCQRRTDGSIDYFIALVDDISEDKLAREALRHSEARWQKVVTEAPFPMIVHRADGTVLTLSRAWTELSGYHASQIRCIDDWLRLTAPEDQRTRVREGIRRLFGRQEPTDEGEFPIRCADGSVRVWMFRSMDIGVDEHGERLAVSVAADVSEQLALAERLQDAVGRYRNLFESNPIAMFAWDAETQRILAINAAGATRYGWTQQEMVGMSIERLRPADEVPALQRAIAALDRQRVNEVGIWTHQRRDGSTLRVEVSIHAIAWESRAAWMTMAVDVTEREQARAERDAYVRRLERAAEGTLQVVSTMVELRDPYTAGHERRVGEVAAAIAAEMGLGKTQQQGLRLCGAVHDVGKIAVPAEILAKPSRLSKTEYLLVQQHAELGYGILKGIDFPWPLAEVARQHHERMDGSGYPRGLKGDEILLEARIIAVADVVESMTSHRPYRAALGPALALAEIEAGRGRLYDAAVVDACLRLFRERAYSLPD
jgi:PAS domain S-box-containing protein